jgi:hypothetical protein
LFLIVIAARGCEPGYPKVRGDAVVMATDAFQGVGDGSAVQLATSMQLPRRDRGER